MSKIAWVAVLAGGMLSIAVPAFAAQFNRDLYYGLRGDADVQSLQSFLTDQGIYTGPINGNFFSMTLQAVKDFQTEHNITPAQGYFGPKTREAANNATAPVISSAAAIQNQITALLALVEKLQADLVQAQAAATAATSSQTVASSTTPAVFNSQLQLQIGYPSLTLSSYHNVIVHAFDVVAQNKTAITKLRFKQNGTLLNANIVNLRLIEVTTDTILATAEIVDGTVEFQLNADANAMDKNLVVSGKSYKIIADIITPNTGGVKPYLRLDLETADAITAVDYDTLTRSAGLDASMTFPFQGPTITTF